MTSEVKGTNFNELELTLDLPLHRIASFSRFVEMVDEQKLTLVSCGKWTDKNEGFLAQKLRTIAGMELVQNLLAQRGKMLPFVGMHLLRQKTYMQCWTAAAEKERMWKEYSPKNDGVRFTTKLGKIASIQSIFVYKVQYRDNLSLEEEIDEIFPDMNGLSVLSTDQVFRRKHKDFDYEEEVRLMSNAWWFDSHEDKPGIKKFSFSHVPKFIEGVIVDPRASDMLIAEVEKFCQEKTIPFYGRSTLNLAS